MDEASRVSPETRNPLVGRRRLSRRVKWSLVMAGTLLVVAWVAATLAARPLIRWKLQGMIDSQLNARLEMDSVSYVFPYGVEVCNASLVAQDGDGNPVELIRVPKLHLLLAQLPFRDGPLCIRKLTFQRPSVHLIKTASGIVGHRTLVRKDVLTTEEEVRQRLSDMFELRLLAVEGGRIVYEDRTLPQTVPAVWRDIEARLTTAPGTNPIYGFEFSSSSGPLAELKAAGQANIDQLELDVQRFAASLRVDPDQKQSPAPAAIQQAILDNRIAGKLRVAGSAHLPLRRKRSARYDATIELAEASATPKGWPGGLESLSMKVRVSTEPPSDGWPATAPSTRPDGAGAVYLALESLEARAGDNGVMVGGSAVAVDWSNWRWTLGQTRMRLTLGSDRTALPPPLKDAITAADIAGVIDLTMHGDGQLPSTTAPRPRFSVDIHMSSPRLLVSDRKLVATDIVCDATLTQKGLRLANDGQARRGLRGTTCGGRVALEGEMRFEPLEFSAQARVEELDLKLLAASLSREKPMRMIGRVMARMDVRMAASVAVPAGSQSASILDGLTGEGEFELTQAEFQELQGLPEMVTTITGSKEGISIDQAAGIFTIGGGKVNFSRVAASAPLMGAQGSGDLYLDGRLDFRLTALPVGDWKKSVQGSNLPLIGGLAAEVAGGMQDLVRSATGALLLQVRILGTVDQPQVKAEPGSAPAGTIQFFGDMIKGGGRLLDKVRQ